MMEKITYRPIGVIHTPFKKPEGTPIQSVAATDTSAVVEIFPEYAEGLEDLDGFSHIILLYHFHLSAKFSLSVRPFLDHTPRGLFATRAPARPNSIGLSIVRLSGISNGELQVMDVDILDGTPLLDVKPYIPKFDVRKVNNIGWLDSRASKVDGAKDDGRFAD